VRLSHFFHIILTFLEFRPYGYDESLSATDSDSEPDSGDEAEPEPREPRELRFLVALTGYRLFVIIVTVGLGTAKAVVSYQTKSTAATTFDWILGVFFCMLCVNFTHFSVVFNLNGQPLH
jgi:hypothetical protein